MLKFKLETQLEVSQNLMHLIHYQGLMLQPLDLKLQITH